MALVFPGEAVAFPDVGPAVTACVLPGAAFKAIRRARWVGLGRRRFVQQPAEVKEVLLRRRPLLQRGIAPLRNEGVRRHAEALSPGYNRLVVGVSIGDLSGRTRNDGRSTLLSAINEGRAAAPLCRRNTRAAANLST